MTASWIEELGQFQLPVCCRFYVLQDEGVLLCSNVPAPPGLHAQNLGIVETDAQGRVVRVCPVS